MGSHPAVSSGVATVDVLASLPVPADLSDGQRDGHICVWGGEALTSATAIALGSRKLDGAIAFLRSCRSCVSRAAMGALFDHSTGAEACKQCQGDPYCEMGRALARTIRLGQR